MNAELVTAEARRAERAPLPDSMDFYFQGRASANKGYTPENMAQARYFYERALALDPNNIEALVGTAQVDFRFLSQFLSDDRRSGAAAAEAALTKVLSLAPNHALAHVVSGGVHIYTNRAEEGIAKCEHALRLDRNLVNAHPTIGMAKIFTGRAEDTESHVLEALHLSPRDTQAHGWMLVAGVAKLYLGSDEEAATWLRRAIETNRNFPIAHFFLAATGAHLGQMSQARAATKAGLALKLSPSTAFVPARRVTIRLI
jgi:tetratricopeptide (TPR) repeat protein